MIGRLKGELIEKQAPNLLIDVAGVGYDVLAPMTTLYRLPDVGSQVIVHTHFSVSENAQQLYGFVEKEDRALFRELIKVNGVGPKMALGILSGMERTEFVVCVMDNNLTALTKVPGVGKKTAERLLVEMRDRLKGWSTQGTGQQEAPLHKEAEGNNVLVAEAQSALVALGYKPAEAVKAISVVQRKHDVSRSEELIRLALRSMLPGK